MNIKLPTIIHFRDYLDIKEFVSKLKHIIPAIKSEDLETICADYYAIFYLQEDDAYDELVREHNREVDLANGYRRGGDR